MKEYVLGFMFNNEIGQLGECALISKTKPEWQAGLLNGIGGKIEDGETPLDAMIREFQEETGYHQKEWKQFATMIGHAHWKVYCFVCEGPLKELKTITDEEVVTRRIEDADGSFIENVQMLMSTAWFQLNTKENVSIEIIYNV